MAFIPKLPTWHNTVTVWRQLAGIWQANGTVVGQVYTPLRGQDDEEGGLIYFQFPKAHVAAIRDGYDAVADVLLLTYPGGGVKGYRVRDVMPRWLGFPNEHMLAALERLTAAQLAAIQANEPDPELMPRADNAATVYRLGGPTWAEHATIDGQLGANESCSETASDCQVGFSFAPEYAEDVRDSFGGVADVLVLDKPGGGQIAYRVVELLPRHPGEPHEHFGTRLERITDAQLADILEGAGLVAAEGGSGDCDQLSHWDDTIEIDNGLDAPFEPARTSPCFWLSAADKQVPPIIGNHTYSVTIGADDKLIVRCHEVISGALVGLWIGDEMDGIVEPPQTLALYWAATGYDGLLSETIDIVYPPP